MRCLGIDTGKKNVGYAVVESRTKGIYQLLDYGLLKIKEYQQLEKLFKEKLEEYNFEVVAYERILNLKGFKTGSYLLEENGILKLLAEKNNLEVSELSPKEIRKHWFVRTKKELQEKIRKYFELKGKISEHTLDAIAIAGCALGKIWKRGDSNG